MKYLFYITIILVTTCNNKQLTNNTKQTSISQQDSALKAYKAQKHRFKVELCKLYYNGQQVRLDTIHHFEKMFGKNHETDSIGSFIYKNIPLTFQSHQIRYNKDSITRMVERLSIRLSHSPAYQHNIDIGATHRNSRLDSIAHASPVLKGYMLIDGQLVHSNSTLEEINAYRKNQGLPLFKSFLGDILDQIIGYGSNYCEPEFSKEPERFTTFLGIYYGESSDYFEHKEDYHRTEIRGLNYSYTQKY